MKENCNGNEGREVKVAAGLSVFGENAFEIGA